MLSFLCVSYDWFDLSVGMEGARGRSRLPLDSNFLTDMFGSDFYSAEEAFELQQEKLQVCVSAWIVYVQVYHVCAF